MKEDAMCIKMFNLCFGEEETSASETDIVCFEDQFLLGLNKFQGLFTVSPCNAAQASLIVPIPEYSALGNDGTPTFLTMLPNLHRQQCNINIYVGKGSLEKTLLSRKSLLNSGASGGRVTPRTLLRLAKDVLCSCKKVQALVTSTKSPYKDGTFPSGTNWDDYIDWCIRTMYMSEKTTEVDVVVAGGKEVTPTPATLTPQELLPEDTGTNAIVVVPGGMDDMVVEEANEDVLQQSAVGVVPAACKAAVEEEEAAGQ